MTVQTEQSLPLETHWGTQTSDGASLIMQLRLPLWAEIMGEADAIKQMVLISSFAGLGLSCFPRIMSFTTQVS